MVDCIFYTVTAHAQGDSLEDARELCADGTYFPKNLRILNFLYSSTFMLMGNISLWLFC